MAVGRDWLSRAAGLARRRVHPAWAMTIAAAAAALLLIALGMTLSEMIDVHRDLRSALIERPKTAEITARIEETEESNILVVHGPPGARLLLTTNDRPDRVVELDGDGSAAVDLGPAGEQTDHLRLSELLPRGVELTRRAETPDSTSRSVTQEREDAPERSTRADKLTAADAPDMAPPILQFVTDGGPRIALTFDGNASNHRTTELLDVLHDLDLRVTLFVTGTFVERYPGIVRRAVLAGHEIGNHTYSHPHLTTYETNRRHALRPGVTRAWLQDQLRRTEKAFQAATGRSMQPLWRAPYGEENRTLRGWALEAGYLHVRWSSLEGASLDSRDWVADEHSSLYQDSPAIMRRLLSFPELRGGLVLMHMSTQREEPPWEDLPAFVAELRRRGVEPVTVSDLLEASPTWQPWLRRAEAKHQRAIGR
jgi:peptidoglycan/xylan/chitin deacetylase (PgdA/CDA1 family)